MASDTVSYTALSVTESCIFAVTSLVLHPIRKRGDHWE
jgi:hypothetical protein